MTILDDIIRVWRIGLGVDAIMAEETTAEFYGGPKEEEPEREDATGGSVTTYTPWRPTRVPFFYRDARRMPAFTTVRAVRFRLT